MSTDNSNSDNPDNLVPDTFAARLRRLMEANRDTQTTLAKRSGIDRSSINRMLKGSRQPQPVEIGILAQCFGVAPDTLMLGVCLPPQLQRAVDKERARTEQLLAAEAARDEAVARADQLAIELERLQAARERDHEDARKAQEASDAKWNDRQRELEAAIRNLEGQMERAEAQRRQLEATQSVLRNQVTAFQQQVAQERSAKASAGVVGGLLGIALGRAMD